MSNAYEKIRNHAGLVDLGEWAWFSVTGTSVAEALDGVVGGNVQELFDGKAMNTLIPGLGGGVDAIIWVIAVGEGFQIVAEPDEADAIASVLATLAEADPGIAWTNMNDTHYHLVLTGPDAEDIAAGALTDDVYSIAFLTAFEFSPDLTAVRIGYFGEYELHLFGPQSSRDDMIARLTEAAGGDILTDDGAFPVMMAEMRVLNRRRDIAPEASVFDVGLQWMVDFRKDNLRGADALNERRDRPGRSCVMVLHDDGVTGPVEVEGEIIGHIQSTYHSTTLGRNVALAYLDSDIAVPGLVLDTTRGPLETVSAPAFLSKSVTKSMGQAD